MLTKWCCQALSISQSLNLSLSLRDRDRADTIITLPHQNGMTLVCLFYNWKSKSLNPIIGYRVKMTLHVNPTCGQMAWPCPDDSKMVWHLVFGLMSLILYPKNVSDTKKVTAF